MNESERQCYRSYIHGAHRWFADREMWQCYGVQAEAEVEKQWTSDKSYTLSDPAWPEFEVRVGSSGALLLWCANCGWSKHFASGQPVLWSVLATATSRHGMAAHVEGEEEQ